MIRKLDILDKSINMLCEYRQGVLRNGDLKESIQDEDALGFIIRIIKGQEIAGAT